MDAGCPSGLALSRRSFLIGGSAVFGMAAGRSPRRIGRRRVAFVLTNWRYKSLPKLLGPKLDGTAVSNAIGRAGFDKIVPITNFTKKQILRIVAQISSQVATDDDVFFYYSGHGVQTGLRNFLIPIDASSDLGTVAKLQQETLSFDMLIGALAKDETRITVAVLDACRDTPSGLPTQDGLPPGEYIGDYGIDLAPENTIVSHSTLPGFQTPDSRYGQISSFTSVFIETLSKSAGLGVVDFFVQLQINAKLNYPPAQNYSKVKMLPWITTAEVPNRPFFAPSAGHSHEPIDLLQPLRRRAVPAEFDFNREHVSIFFAPDRADVPAAEMTLIQSVANWMARHERETLTLMGFAAPIQMGFDGPNRQYMVGLGARRADAVASALANAGGSPVRLATMGMGVPANLEPTAAAWAAANRVIIVGSAFDTNV